MSSEKKKSKNIGLIIIIALIVLLLGGYMAYVKFFDGFPTGNKLPYINQSNNMRMPLISGNGNVNPINSTISNVKA